MSGGRTALVGVRIAVCAVLAAGVLLTPACAGTAVGVLDADVGTSAHVPRGVARQLDVEQPGVRELASQRGVTFFAARPRAQTSGTVCLLAFWPQDASPWHAACSDGPLSMVVGGVTAKLYPDGIDTDIPAGWLRADDYLLVREG